jgi:hypothetical protein
VCTRGAGLQACPVLFGTSGGARFPHSPVESQLFAFFVILLDAGDVPHNILRIICWQEEVALDVQQGGSLQQKRSEGGGP